MTHFSTVITAGVLNVSLEEETLKYCCRSLLTDGREVMVKINGAAKKMAEIFY